MNDVIARRPYRQSRRAETAEATAGRIVDAFMQRLFSGWFTDVRLDDVAADSGVTVQTVLRRFGSKDGLLEATSERMGDEIRARRAAPRGDIPALIGALVDDYETTGDLIIRLLAQEDTHPAMRKMTDVGRAHHRAWVAEAFSEWLDPAAPDRLDALIVLTDIYTWKLIRRDMSRPREELEALILRLLPAALDISAETFDWSSK